jgi:hypothetical protein
VRSALDSKVDEEDDGDNEEPTPGFSQPPSASLDDESLVHLVRKIFLPEEDPLVVVVAERNRVEVSAASLLLDSKEEPLLSSASLSSPLSSLPEA